MEIIKSTSFEQDEILNNIQKLHCPNGFECDMTFGNGQFWKTIKRPKYCYDIDPNLTKKDTSIVCCDNRLLPLERESIESIIFDPPFLTYIRSGREGNKNMALARQYGGYWSYEELEDHYRDSISEAYRVLRRKGVFVVKCQDIIHNHKLQATHLNVCQMADIEGFRLKDLFVLNAKNRMPSPQKGQQRHARIFHSYFLVFTKL